MKSEHVKELLSSYLDDALEAEERGRVKRHISDCAECRGDLAELERISKIVKELPKEALPAGFMARLERKRLEASAESYRPAQWLPAPARLAAFAATGVLVCVMFVREVKYRLAPAILPGMGAAVVSGLESDMDEAMKEDIDEARRRMVAEYPANKAAWRGALGGSSGAGEVLPMSAAPPASLGGREAAAPAVSGKKVDPSGVPVSENGKPRKIYSNEELQEFLLKERERVGIRKVVMPNESPADPWRGVPDRPLNRAEAMQAVRQMASRLSGMNRARQERMRPTVPLGEGTTPSLIRTEEISRPLMIASPGGRPDRGAGDGFAGMTRVSREMVPKPSSSFLYSKERATPAPESDKIAGMNDSESLSIVRAQATVEKKEDDARRRRPAFRREWTSSTGGLGVAGGAVIRNAEDLADLWGKIKTDVSLPRIDFSKEMVIAVFGSARADNLWEAEIISIIEEGGLITVRHASRPVAGAAGPSAPYQIVVVNRSPLRFSFQQVR